MKALKMALALALAVASTIVAPNAVSANVSANQDIWLCFYQFSFWMDGVLYDVYRCERYVEVI